MEEGEEGDTMPACHQGATCLLLPVPLSTPSIFRTFLFFPATCQTGGPDGIFLACEGLSGQGGPGVPVLYLGGG